MEIDHLRTFQSVARSGSVTAASHQLHFAQSTVSVHIRALEQEVGVPQFDRLPSGVQLTEAGRRLLPLSQQILDLAASAAEVGGDGADADGEVAIAAPETIVAHRLPAVLRHLREQHPGVRVRLVPLPYAEIRAAVSGGTVDLGFLLQPPVKETSSLAVQQLSAESLVMVAAAEHPLAERGKSDVAERFAATTLLLTERGCGYRPLVEAHLDMAGVRPGHVLEFDSVDAIRRCVEAGLGVAVIPQPWLAEAMLAGSLVALDWFAPRFEVATQLIWHPARWHGPAIAAVVAASTASIT